MIDTQGVQHYPIDPATGLLLGVVEVPNPCELSLLLDNSLTDSSPNAFTVTAPNGYSSAADKFEQAGQAIQLAESSSQYLSTNYNGSTANVSISLWMKLDAITSLMALYEKENNGAVINRVGLNLVSGQLRWINEYAASTYATSLGETLSVGEWYHIVLTITSDGVLKWYINGQLYGTDTNANFLTGAYASNLENWRIGIDYANTAGRYFDGELSKLKIHNRELTLAEIDRAWRQQPKGIDYISFQTESISTITPTITSPIVATWNDGIGNTYTTNSPTLDYTGTIGAKTFRFGHVNMNQVITTINVNDCILTGSIPDLSSNINLSGFRCYNNQLTGSIPDLSSNINLNTFYCYNNQLTGSIPDLSSNVSIVNFRCDNNQLTGSIPDLSSNINLVIFYCNDNQLTGSIPDLSSNINIVNFFCNDNQLTGSIPDLSSNINLSSFRCNDNQLTGSIPDLSSNINLTNFYCYNNQLTGSIPDLSSNVSIVNFYCYNNQLTGVDLDSFVLAEYSLRVLRGNKSFNCQIQNNTSGISTDSVARIEGTGSYKYQLFAVAGTSFQLTGDYTAEFPTNSEFTTKDNSDVIINTYTVISSSFDGTYTTINVSATSTETTADYIGDGMNDRGSSWTYTAA